MEACSQMLRGGGWPYYLQKLLYAVFTIAVNIFVLISAYFLVKSKFKIKKLLALWLQVLFYGIAFYLISCAIDSSNFGVGFVFYLAPITSNAFWFITAYLLLYLISPFLNIILNNASKKQLTILVVGIFILDYLATRFGINAIVNFNSGYSLIWFMFLYILGGYLRLYPLKIKKIWLLLIYLVSTFALWGMTFIENNVYTAIFYNPLEYTSPLVLLNSICALMLFKDIKIKSKFWHTLICFISSCTFGIYLFQESAIKPYLYFNILKVQFAYGSVLSPLYVLLFALEIFALGLLVEIIRKSIVFAISAIYKKIKGKHEHNL